MRKSLKQPVPENRSPTVESKVAIKRHPLHPILVVYPIAGLSLLLPSDLLFLWTGESFWAQVSWLLNLLGLASGLFAAVFGVLDMALIRVARRHVSVWNHFIAGVMLLALAALGVWLRFADPEAVWPWAVVQSSLCLLMVGVVGWLGGTLTFGHGIGVYGHTGKDYGADDAPGE
jgi:uncharacterized membrane protein